MKVTTKLACEMARSLGDITEKDHFGSDAFYANKRIFATVWHDRNEVNLRLTPEQQRHFLSLDGEGFAEIDNAWGREGWTRVQLDFVDRKNFVEALKAAWKHSGSKVARSASVRTQKKKDLKSKSSARA